MIVLLIHDTSITPDKTMYQHFNHSEPHVSFYHVTTRARQ